MAEADRLEKVLALVLLHSMRGASQQEKIVQLSLAGFSNVEIANLLQTTSALVAQSLYAARRTSTTGWLASSRFGCRETSSLT